MTCFFRGCDKVVLLLCFFDQRKKKEAAEQKKAAAAAKKKAADEEKREKKRLASEAKQRLADEKKRAKERKQEEQQAKIKLDQQRARFWSAPDDVVWAEALFDFEMEDDDDIHYLDLQPVMSFLRFALQEFNLYGRVCSRKLLCWFFRKMATGGMAN